MTDLTLERAAPAKPVFGVDEAGRGPWAGPVVAAAVMIPEGADIAGLNDSKKLTPARRAAAFARILAFPHGIGLATVAEIDRLNILQASFLAMRRALAAAPVAPGFALIDGRHELPGAPCPTRAVIGGDGLSASIAAASILAKVTRDRIMADLACAHPGYGWETNAGYGVAAHAQALRDLGVTPHHRRSFKPIHNMLCEENPATY